jgi:hypothetical protein
MPLEHWFGDLPEMAPVPAQIAALAALGDGLDQLRPAELDRERSCVRWVIEEPDEDDDDPRPLLLVILEHTTRSDATVEVAIWPDQALIQWLGQTENTRDHCGDDPDDEWPTYAAEVVADILAGYRLVENTYWRGRWRRTRWYDVRDPANRERLSTEVGPAFWWLFVTLPGAQVEHERVDFGAQARH